MLDPNKIKKTLHFCKALINSSEHERIRTFDRLLRRQMLYPAELRDPIFQKKYFKNVTKRNINEIFYCRGGRIRTCDLLVPNQAR